MLLGFNLEFPGNDPYTCVCACVCVCVCVCVKSIIKLILKISMLYHMFIPHNKKERDKVVEGEKKGGRERKNK